MAMQTGYRVREWGGELHREDFERPEPGPGEVLVEVEACGVGLTVLNCMNGDLSDDPRLLPRVPGHELVGRVVELGSGADPALEGRRVIAYFYLACGTCRACSAGRHARCERLRGWVGVHRDGGYAPFAVLPELNAVVVPEELDPVAATVAPDAVATPLHVCGDRAGITPGDRVVVVGAGGGVGAHMVQVAGLYGGDVVGLDITSEKLETVEELGAHGVDSSDFSSVAAERLWPEGRPTVVIDLVGSADSLRWSADALATGGRLVVLTTFRDRQLEVDPRELVFREASIIGSRYAGRSELSAAAGLLAGERIRPVIGATGEPEDIPRMHEQLRAGQLVGRGAVVWNQEAER